MENSVFLKSWYDLIAEAGTRFACPALHKSQPGEDEAGDQEVTTGAADGVSRLMSDLDKKPPKKKRISGLTKELEDWNKTGEQERPKTSRHERTKGSQPSYCIAAMDAKSRKVTRESGHKL